MCTLSPLAPLIRLTTNALRDMTGPPLIQAHEDSLPRIALLALCGRDRGFMEAVAKSLNLRARGWDTAWDPFQPDAPNWVESVRGLRVAMLPQRVPTCGRLPYDEGLGHWWTEQMAQLGEWRSLLNASEAAFPILPDKVDPPAETLHTRAIEHLVWAAALGFWSAPWRVPAVKDLLPEESWRGRDARGALPSGLPPSAGAREALPVIRMRSPVHAWLLYRRLLQSVPASEWADEDPESSPHVAPRLHLVLWQRLRALRRPAWEAVDRWTPHEIDVDERAGTPEEDPRPPRRREVLARLRNQGIDAGKLPDAAIAQLAAALLIHWTPPREREAAGPRHVKRIVDTARVVLERFFEEGVELALGAAPTGSVVLATPRETLMRLLSGRQLASEGGRILHGLRVSGTTFDALLQRVDPIRSQPARESLRDVYRRVALGLGLPADASADADDDAFFPFRPRRMFARAAQRASAVLRPSGQDASDADVIHAAMFSIQVMEASLRRLLACLYAADVHARAALDAEPTFKKAKKSERRPTDAIAVSIKVITNATLNPLARYLEKIDLRLAPIHRRVFELQPNDRGEGPEDTVKEPPEQQLRRRVVALLQRLSEARNRVMHARGPLTPAAVEVLVMIGDLDRLGFRELLPRRCRVSETGRGLWGARTLLLDEDGTRVDVCLPEVITIGRRAAPLDVYAMSKDDVWWWRPKLVQAAAVDRYDQPG